MTLLAKIQYKVARDHRPLLVTFADKLEARRYVEHVVGPEWLLPVYTSASSFDDLDWSSVPEEFALKVNHASGGVVVVSTSAPRDFRLPPVEITKEKMWGKYVIHPKSLDRQVLSDWVSLWLSQRFRWAPGEYHQWAYSEIRPQVFIERYVRGIDGFARNLKIHTLHGEIETLALTTISREGGEQLERKFLPSEMDEFIKALGVPIPVVERMMLATRALSGETDFVRVDWLVDGNEIWFGELTNYPAAGIGRAAPTATLSSGALERHLNKRYAVPRRYSSLPQGSYPYMPQT